MPTKSSRLRGHCQKHAFSFSTKPMARPRRQAPFLPIDSLIDMPNVIRTRTFSKAYGLAGARVGYVISTPGTAQAFDKIRNHFGMNRIGTASGCRSTGGQGLPG